jgi:hypothetical protein
LCCGWKLPCVAMIVDQSGSVNQVTAGQRGLGWLTALRLRCAPACGSKEGIFSLCTRHLFLGACYAPRNRTGLLSGRPAEAGLGFLLALPFSTTRDVAPIRARHQLSSRQHSPDRGKKLDVFRSLQCVAERGSCAAAQAEGSACRLCRVTDTFLTNMRIDQMHTPSCGGKLFLLLLLHFVISQHFAIAESGL